MLSCQQVTERLSSLFDGELAGQDASALESHLAACAECCVKYEAIEAMSRLFQASPSVAPPDLWGKIAEARESQRIRPRRLRIAPAAWIAAATAASILLATWLMWGTGHQEADHRRMAADFEKFFDEFDRNPASANKIFLASYPSEPVDDRSASKILGGPSLSRFQKLAGCELRERHLVSMPCCRCVQSVYVRPDGRPVIVFEHTNPQPEWFEHATSENVPCPEGTLCKMNIDHANASVITLNLGTHHATIVGADGVDEARAILRENEPSA